MTDTATAAPESPLTVVLEESTDFAPRTRKATSDALTALKPSLDAVKAASPKVFTIVKGVDPKRAASLVSLLNERYPRSWTFGGRSTDDGTAIVQARYSESPELARPVRKVTRKPKGTATTAAPKAGTRK
jgi:hypothetical protein